jgi:hypothetical protein
MSGELLGQVISVALLVVAIVLVAWRVRRQRPKPLNRLSRRSVLTRQLPKSNGKGSKHGNRRLWKGHTRKPRPAPSSPNGHHRSRGGSK